MPMANEQKPLADEVPVERLVGRPVPERATVGDVVAVDVRHPYPQTLRLTLETQAAADKANVLLSMEPKVWRLEKLLPVGAPFEQMVGRLPDEATKG